jgi:hypothetical protein
VKLITGRQDATHASGTLSESRLRRRSRDGGLVRHVGGERAAVLELVAPRGQCTRVTAEPAAPGSRCGAEPRRAGQRWCSACFAEANPAYRGRKRAGRETNTRPTPRRETRAPAATGGDTASA